MKMDMDTVPGMGIDVEMDVLQHRNYEKGRTFFHGFGITYVRFTVRN